MKRALLLIVLLVSVNAFAQQDFDKRLLSQAPNCESVAFNSSKLIENYFQKKDYDSIQVVYDRWEEFCGTTEPLFRLKVLQQIQVGTFSEEWIKEESLNNFIFLYLNRLEYSKETNAKLIYENYKIPFGYITFNSFFDDLTVLWANSLLERESLSSEERAFCLLYSNKTNDFWALLKSNQLSGTKLHKMYSEQVQKIKKMSEANLGILSGVMLPFGNLNEVIGIKPSFGFQLGMKKEKMQYDFTLLFRTGKAKQEYLVDYQGELKMTDHYFGGYLGFDISRELWQNKKRELDFLTGIAYDGFDAVEGDTEKEIKGKSINSLNLNLGLGYRFYSKRMNYWGIQTKYNFVNYANNKGTDLKGNYTSVILSYNFFGNVRKYSMMEKFKMK